MTEPDEAELAPPPPRFQLLSFCFLFILIAAAQTWVITAGWWTHLPGSGTKYSQLADAFAHGQVSLLQTPPAGLLALPDPYDPVTNAPFRRFDHDSILFSGKFYFFWGPVPALLVLAAREITGNDTLVIRDVVLVLTFSLTMSLLFTFLILRMRRTLFPALSSLAAWPPVLSLGLGTPLLFMLARPAIYEASIIAGQLFLIAGVCLVWRHMSRPKSSTAWLAAAGICWALSMGSRLSLGPALGLLGVFVILHNRSFIAAVSIFLPLIVCAALIGGYNFARFGSITEFGLQYQLSAHNQHTASAGAPSSLGYLLPNLLRYLFQPPIWSSSFPYLTAPSNTPGIDSAFNLGAIYNFEPLVGLIWTQPFLLLAPFAFLRADPPCDALNWRTPTLLAAAAVLAIAPAMTLAGSTMRYLLDAVPCLTLLAAIGYWQLLSRTKSRTKLIHLAAFTFISVQAAAALLLATTGYINHFANQNPVLFRDMAQFFPSL